LGGILFVNTVVLRVFQRFSRLSGGLKVAGSNPVAPTLFRNKPFGEHVEGLSASMLTTFAEQRQFTSSGVVPMSFCQSAQLVASLGMQRFKRTHAALPAQFRMGHRMKRARWQLSFFATTMAQVLWPKLIQ
jgi:hypothetical protein